jgi:hypothetical protein
MGSLTEKVGVAAGPDPHERLRQLSVVAHDRQARHLRFGDAANGETVRQR